MLMTYLLRRMVMRQRGPLDLEKESFPPYIQRWLLTYIGPFCRSRGSGFCLCYLGNLWEFCHLKIFRLDDFLGSQCHKAWRLLWQKFGGNYCFQYPPMNLQTQRLQKIMAPLAYHLRPHISKACSIVVEKLALASMPFSFFCSSSKVLGIMKAKLNQDWLIVLLQ